MTSLKILNCEKSLGLVLILSIDLLNLEISDTVKSAWHLLKKLTVLPPQCEGIHLPKDRKCLKVKIWVTLKAANKPGAFPFQHPSNVSLKIISLTATGNFFNSGREARISASLNWHFNMLGTNGRAFVECGTANCTIVQTAVVEGRTRDC
jgi:hypothetical protein